MTTENIAIARAKLFADTRCVVGEGPLWCARERAFYWLDLSLGHVYRKREADVSTDAFECFKLDVGKIGGMVLTKSGSLLLFCQEGNVYSWRPRGVPVKIAQLPEAKGGRFNDVIASPEGGVFCGVIHADKTGTLWYFSPEKKFARVDGVFHGNPNGMGFSPDGKTFYFAVSEEYVIYKYDYSNAVCSNRKVFAAFPENGGCPDGLTVDSRGNVWTAMWNGAAVLKFSHDGGKIGEYKFPIKKTTSVAFGGEKLDRIVITTANTPWSEDDFERFKSGGVFEISDGSTGLPEFCASF